MTLGHLVSHGSFKDDVRRLGMEAEFLRAAISNGNLERTRVLGRHNARSAQGFYAWNGVLSKLSETYEEIGWERKDPMSLPVLLHKELQNLLFVSSGDAYTGVTGANHPPKSRNPKGSLVGKLARQNKRLTGETPLPIEVPATKEEELASELQGYTSYVLLVHFSREDYEARYEISRLEHLDSKGYLSPSLPHRLIAPAYPLLPEHFDDFDPNEGFEGPEEYPVPPKG